MLPTVQSLLRDIRNTRKLRPHHCCYWLSLQAFPEPPASFFTIALASLPPFPALIFTHFSIVLTISQFLFPHLSFPGYICVLCRLLCTATNACQEPVFMVHSTPTCCYLCLGLLLKWTLLHKSNQIIPHRITEQHLKLSRVETERDGRFQKLHFITSVASLPIISSQRSERKHINLKIHVNVYQRCTCLSVDSNQSKQRKTLGTQNQYFQNLYTSRLAAHMKVQEIETQYGCVFGGGYRVG